MNSRAIKYIGKNNCNFFFLNKEFIEKGKEREMGGREKSTNLMISQMYMCDERRKKKRDGRLLG